MKWSLKIMRVTGIDIRVHATFLLLLGWVGFVEYASHRTAHAVLGAVVFTLAVFVTIVMHELGHSLTARRFGVQTREITLLPIGGVSRLDRMPEEPRQELWIAIAGPAVSIAIAVILYVFLRVTALTIIPDAPALDYRPFIQRLMWVNIALAGFNLLPAFPMDGGRVLRAALATRMPYARATQIAARMGQGVALLIGLVGLFTSPFLMVIALFVWMGAAQEGTQAQIRNELTGVPVRAAMVTEFRTMEPEDSLGGAAEVMLAGGQEDFPVVEGDRLTGVLTRQGLLRALSERGSLSTVGAAMERDFLTADPGQMLSDVLARLPESECHTVPVVREGRVLGLITPENVAGFISIQAARSHAASHARPSPRHAV
jgi:Zn-dependent protease/CBS domain-containing protein